MMNTPADLVGSIDPETATLIALLAVEKGVTFTEMTRIILGSVDDHKT